MVFGGGILSATSLIIVSLVIITVWILLEIKRLKHKIFLISSVFLIISLYFGAIIVFQDRNIDFTSYSGMVDATKIYFSWLGSVFGNLKIITAGATQLDWKNVNETSIT